MRISLLILGLALSFSQIFAQSISINKIDSIKDVSAGFSMQLRGINSLNASKQKNLLNGYVEFRYQARFQVNRLQFLLQPQLFMGNFGEDQILLRKSGAPLNYVGESGPLLAGNYVLSYKLSDRSVLATGKATFSEDIGYRGLLHNSLSAPIPFLGFSWTGKKFFFNYRYQIAQNPKGEYPDNEFYSKHKGIVHHKFGYQNHWLRIAVFEAITWAANDSSNQRYIEAQYLIPFVPYRPVEFQSGSSDNALLGGELQLNKNGFTAYGKLIFDEFLLRELKAGDGWWANKWSLQLGLEKSFVIGNGTLKLRLEHNRTRPFTFGHNFVAQGWHHRGRAIGHPLGNNFSESILRGQVENQSFKYGFHLSAIELGSRLAQDGGDIYSSSNNRKSDYGYQAVEIPDNYLFYSFWLDRKVEVNGNPYWLQLAFSSRTGYKNDNDYWLEVGIRRGIFKNYYQY
ncbi:capsule assembly Wzi family protein [Luteibaculum oceani]|uniref:Capsule assembly Wzi family protein n=1 Tax=Luteibaculum oceani TaxID=1294296 RepID=A0A5C6VPE6_9FLAO|nr:capsule assembly Wzi family protein [Luteibaculum oceani]TXC85048.1 capsule assembly Wzi family protein [Luteibaculum oceani]